VSTPSSVRARVVRLWTGSIRRQLIVGIALVHAVLMAIFVVDLVGRQRAFLDQVVERQATGLAQAVAASSTSWVLANDGKGLGEVVAGVQGYPGVRTVMVLSPELRVLGHTRADRVGTWLVDPASQRMAKASLGAQTLIDDPDSIDAIAPVLASGGRHIGWARVTLRRDLTTSAVHAAKRDGVVYAGLAIAVGVAFAFLLGTRLTRGLRALVDVTDRVRRGEPARATPSGDDELGRLAIDLNVMLDAIETEHQAREALQEQLTQARRMDALGQLAGGVAHDFNNLLAAIVGYTHLALDGTLDRQVRADLEEVLTASGRAKDLVAQILTFSRGRVGRREPVELGVVIAEIAKTLGPSLTGIESRWACDDDVPTLQAGRSIVHQMITNLCVNARDALQGRGHLSVRARVGHHRGTCASCRQTIDGEYVSVEVHDDGPGVPKGLVERIFEPFFSTKERRGGTGLGLAMTHGAIHAHAGHIVVSSAPGDTTFSLLFPRQAATHDAPSARAFVAGGAPASGHGRVLVVDDERAVATAISRMLALRGFDVAVEIDAEQALERALREDFAAVVTDFAMPKLTGLELATRLRAERGDVVVVLCTGNDAAVDDPSAVDALFRKPVEMDALTRRLDALIEARRARAAHRA
jgi:signal transduction histidine kinase